MRTQAREPGSEGGSDDQRDEGLDGEQDDEEEPADFRLLEDEESRQGERRHEDGGPPDVKRFRPELPAGPQLVQAPVPECRDPSKPEGDRNHADVQPQPLPDLQLLPIAEPGEGDEQEDGSRARPVSCHQAEPQGHHVSPDHSGGLPGNGRRSRPGGATGRRPVYARQRGPASPAGTAFRCLRASRTSGRLPGGGRCGTRWLLVHRLLVERRAPADQGGSSLPKSMTMGSGRVGCRRWSIGVRGLTTPNPMSQKVEPRFAADPSYRVSGSAVKP